MNQKPKVSLFQVQSQPYLYLYVDAKKKNGSNYLFAIDKEYGGINSASIPGIDLNYELNSENYPQLHSDEFLVGVFYKINKDKKQDLILCTANTQKASSNSQNSVTINVFNHIIYRINEISFYNVSKKTVSTILRPDLYFSPEFDLTSNFPYINNTIGYSKVLDNNNKFCWNKELIRPFSKFYGNPCIIILQGSVDRLFDGEPELIFISKFIQVNPFDLNLVHKEDKNIIDDEVKCQCELIFPPLGKFEQSSHLWMIVKTKHIGKKYFNKSDVEVISFDISNKFTQGSLFDQFKLFETEHSNLFKLPFNFLFSDYNENIRIDNQNRQQKIFYLIGDDIHQLLNASFLYVCSYVNDFQCFSEIKTPLFNSGTNSKKEIPIKKDLLYFFRKSIYHTGNIINNGHIIQWSVNPDDTDVNFYKESNDLYKFVKVSKSEKFILDPRHISLSYFNPSENSNLIKVKAHFQDEFVVSQISFHLRHRDPSQIITMLISFDEDTLNHYIYCPEVPLPNPENEETYIFNLRKIAKESLLYPVDFKCFEKFRFVTIHFNNQPAIDVNDFSKMIQENDIKFIVKRPINKKPKFEIIQNEEIKKNEFLISEILDFYLNKKEAVDISLLRDFETTRVEIGISNFERCLYFIKNSTNPSIFDIRSYIDRSKNRCPFCGKKLTRSNQFFYEEYLTFPSFICHTESQSSKSFAICNDCSNKYTNGGQLKPSKSNFITNDSIRGFLNLNKKNLINLNEFVDLQKIEIPYQTEPETLISQNATVYRHSFDKCTGNEVQKLLSINSNSNIKFKSEVPFLIFFQYKVNMKKILYKKNSDFPISLSVSTPHDGMIINSEENPISFQTGIECSSVELSFNPKGKEISLENIKIFGNFLPPNLVEKDQRGINTSKEVIQCNQNSILLECKSKPDDRFKTMQTFPHTGIVKGYKIQIKKGAKLSSIVVAFYKQNQFVSHRCILLPDKLSPNDNKDFYIPDQFSSDHDSIKFFYLDRQPCDYVIIKIDTVKE